MLGAEPALQTGQSLVAAAGLPGEGAAQTHIQIVQTLSLLTQALAGVAQASAEAVQTQLFARQAALQAQGQTAAQAVHKMTLSPAKALRLKGKGVLTPGADADINVFALKELHEAGTYTDPCREAEGMDTVIVGGGVALEKGVLTSGFGRVVRR